MKKSIISESQIVAAIKEQESEKRWQISAVHLAYIRQPFIIGVCYELKTSRSQEVLFKRWRWALRNQLAGAGFKPVYAALIKS